MNLEDEIARLSEEVARLSSLISEMISPSEALKIAEKSRIIRQAHASGNPSKIRKANKQINRM